MKHWILAKPVELPDDAFGPGIRAYTSDLESLDIVAELIPCDPALTAARDRVVKTALAWLSAWDGIDEIEFPCDGDRDKIGDTREEHLDAVRALSRLGGQA